MVALDEGDEAVGSAHVLSDGGSRAYLTTMAVAADRRRQGIGAALVREALERAGGAYLDLLTDGTEVFYESFPEVRRLTGFRLRPPP